MYVAQPIEWTDRGVVMLDPASPASEEIHPYVSRIIATSRTRFATW